MAMKVRYTVVNGEVLNENRGGIKRDYVPDPLGSTVALLDSTQTQQSTFSYWPYGEVKASAGSTVTPFQYVGTLGYYHDSSSKTYVRARFLDTQKGRWLTQDPIGFQGGDWNLYRYVGNNPVNWLDPTGLQQKNGPKPLPSCWQITHSLQTCYTCCRNRRDSINCAQEKAACLAKGVPSKLCEAFYKTCLQQKSLGYSICLLGCDLHHPHPQPIPSPPYDPSKIACGSSPSAVA